MDVVLQSVLQAFQFVVQQLESEHQVFLLSNRLLSTRKIFTVDQKKYAFFCNCSSVMGRVLFVSLLLCSQVDLAIQARENDPRGSSAIGRSLAFQWKLDSSNVSWQKWIYHNSCIRLVSSMCLVCYFSTKTAPIMDRFNTSLGVMYGDQCK